METQSDGEKTEPRTLTGKEAVELRKRYKESGIPLPEGIIGIGQQRLGTSSEWGLTVYTEPGVDASEFVDEHFAGLRVFVEEPGTGEAYSGSV